MIAPKKATGKFPPFYETHDFQFYSHWASYPIALREHMIFKTRSKIMTDPLPADFVQRVRIKRRQAMAVRDPANYQKYLARYDHQA